MENCLLRASAAFSAASDNAAISKESLIAALICSKVWEVPSKVHCVHESWNESAVQKHNQVFYFVLPVPLINRFMVSGPSESDLETRKEKE